MANRNTGTAQAENRDPSGSGQVREVVSLQGAIRILISSHPTFAFHFEVTFDLDHPILLRLASQKPPLHFHPYQREYIQVLEGELAVQTEDKEIILRAEDGILTVEPWVNHRLYPPPVDSGGARKCRFLLTGDRTPEPYSLDELFFRNWYEYQEAVILGHEKLNLIRVMSMFDAGGSYLSLPWWVPFSRTVARAGGIFLGRWMGSMLGYKPFYEKWSPDWDLACRKMETSLLQKRFAQDHKEE